MKYFPPDFVLTPSSIQMRRNAPEQQVETEYSRR